jgi:hypothetical protein
MNTLQLKKLQVAKNGQLSYLSQEPFFLSCLINSVARRRPQINSRSDIFYALSRLFWIRQSAVEKENSADWPRSPSQRTIKRNNESILAR